MLDERNGALPAHGKLEWARRQMPILASLKKELSQTLPFAGLTIGICLHLEPKTGVWLDVLSSGGARIVATGSPGTTQDSAVAAMRLLPNVELFGSSADVFADHLEHCSRVLAARPDLIADNGGDLHALLANEPHFSDVRDGLRGATEETTSGGFRLREELPRFDFATFVINDTNAKRIIENRYGVGVSVVDGIMRATNVMLNGRVAIVAGFGFCGSGIAARLRGMGARVLVADSDPMKLLEAHMEGFEVGALKDLLPRADLVVTATGRVHILDVPAFSLMKNGCIVANAGHFANEVDMKGLGDITTVKRLREQIDVYQFADGREIFLLSDANPVNLSAADGNPIEIMDLGLALQTLSLVQLAKCGPDQPKGVWPVPHEIEQRVARLALSHWVGMAA